MDVVAGWLPPAYTVLANGAAIGTGVAAAATAAGAASALAGAGATLFVFLLGSHLSSRRSYGAALRWAPTEVAAASLAGGAPTEDSVAAVVRATTEKREVTEEEYTSWWVGRAAAWQ